jgi:hypothetical protein
MSLGKGTLSNTSTKQKLNTCSSTKTELVPADDFMPVILWTNYFLEAQGYGHQDTILYQDIQSAILLEKNVGSLAAREPNTSTADLILSLTEFITMNSPLSIVPRKK